MTTTTSTIVQVYDGATWNVPPAVTPLGPTSTIGFAPFADGSGTVALYCAYQTANRTIRYTTFDGEDWAPLDGALSNAATCTAPTLVSFRGRLYCFYQGTDSKGSRTGILKYVAFDGAAWTAETSVPNAPSMSESPAAAVYLSPADVAGDMLYCVYQVAGDKGHLTGVTFDGSSWAAISPAGIPGMSNSPAAAVYQDALYVLYQDSGKKGHLTGAVYSAQSNSWSPLIAGGAPVHIPTITDAMITGSPAASVWDTTLEAIVSGQPETQTPVAQLFSVFQGGGNSGKFRCVSFDGASWFEQTTFPAGMPHESSPGLASLYDYLITAYPGTPPAGTGQIPFTMGPQDVYLRMPFDSMQAPVLAGAQGGDATAAYIKTQYASTDFFNWLDSVGDDAWIQVYDHVNDEFYLVAVQEGATSNDNVSMVISGQAVPGIFASADTAAPQRQAGVVGSWSNGTVVGNRPVDGVIIEQIIGAIRPRPGQTTGASIPGASAASVQPPSTFTLDGSTYKITGSVTNTFVVNNQSIWYIQAPLGLASTTGIGVLATVAWTSLLKPLAYMVGRGLLRLVAYFRNAPAAIAEEAGYAMMGVEGAAEGGAIGAEAAAATTISVSTGGLALAGIAVIALTSYIVEVFVLHDTYHAVKVCNFTTYDVTWDIPYFNDGHGAIKVSPVIAQGSTTANKTLPAIGADTFIVGGQSVSVPVFHEADFGVASGSQLSGVQYVMTFTLSDPAHNNAIVGTSSVVLDIPFAGDNSVYANVTNASTAPTASACSQLYNQYSGTNKRTQYVGTGSLNNGSTLQVTATYDKLSGKQPPPYQPGGKPEYWYNSLIVLQTPTS